MENSSVCQMIVASPGFAGGHELSFIRLMTGQQTLEPAEQAENPLIIRFDKLRATELF